MYSPFRHIDSIILKRKPIQLTLFLTRRCNAKCPFCFYLSKKSDSALQEEELTTNEIEKVSASLGKLLWLAFSGGEIFLRKDLVEISEIFYQNNKPAIILFPTNGLMPDRITATIEEVIKRCPKSSIVVKLSLDGPEEVHDTIRGVKGCYQKTLATYKSLERFLNIYPNFDLGINTVFCAENQDCMDEVIEFVKGLKSVRTHTVSLIRGDVSDDDLKKVDLGKYLQTINKLAADLQAKQAGIYGFSGARLKAAQDILQRKVIYQTAATNKKQVDCYAGRLNLVLTQDGNLFPCESFSGSMGNVRDFDYDIGKILVTDKARKRIKQIADNECFCTHECYTMTNLLFNPRQYSKLIKEYLKLL